MDPEWAFTPGVSIGPVEERHALCSDAERLDELRLQLEGQLSIWAHYYDLDPYGDECALTKDNIRDLMTRIDAVENNDVSASQRICNNPLSLGMPIPGLAYRAMIDRGMIENR